MGEGGPSPQFEVSSLLASLATGLGRSSFPAAHSQAMLNDVARAHGHPTNLTVLSTVSIINDPGTGTVVMQTIDNGTYRSDQIVAVQEQLALARSATAPPAEITAALGEIANRPPPLPTWVRVLGYGLAAAGFGAVFRLRPTELLIALVLGLVVAVALLRVSSSSRAGALLPVAATFAVALVVGLVTVTTGVDDPVRLAVIPVFFLLPGATLTTAVIELVNGDMLAGSSRLSFALMQLAGMGFAFVLAIQLTGVSASRLDDLPPASGPAWLPWLGALTYALGLTLYNCVPGRLRVPTVLLAVFAFFVQQAGAQWLSPAMAGGVATMLALLGAYVLNSREGDGPAALVLFMPAFWLVVPGSAGFTALTGALTSNASLARLGPQVVLTIVGMAIGIMVASLIWARVRPWSTSEPD